MTHSGEHDMLIPQKAKCPHNQNGLVSHIFINMSSVFTAFHSMPLLLNCLADLPKFNLYCQGSLIFFEMVSFPTAFYVIMAH